MAEINWKSKYIELKAKYMSAVDAAFRIGMEQGMQQAQVQQAQDQAAQQQTQDQQAQDGQPGQESAPQDGDEQSGSENPQGSELDQHISQLEGMLGKSELTVDDMQALQKSVAALKFGIEMKKSDIAVRSIANSLRPAYPAVKIPTAISKTADANLNNHAKAALNLQAQIVANVMAGFEEEEVNLSKNIANIVAGEGLKKD